MEKQKSGFWGGTFGQVLRWIVLVPVSLILFRLAEFIPILAADSLASLDAPAWGMILILLMGGGFFLYLLFPLAIFTPHLVSLIAPNTQIGLSIVGVIYGLWQLFNVVNSFLVESWYVSIIKTVVGATILITTVVAYSEES
jgi:hypothetical protein